MDIQLRWKKVIGCPYYIRKKIFKFVLVAPIICLIPALSFDERIIRLTFVFAGFFFFGGFIVLLVSTFDDEPYNKIIHKINRGEYIQKWRYNFSEWQTFIRQELKRYRQDYISNLKRTVIFAITLNILALIFIHKDLGILLFTVNYIFTVLLTTIFYFKKLREHDWIQYCIKSEDKILCETYIGQHYIVVANKCYNLTRFNKLGSVLIQGNCLVFTTEQGKHTHNIHVLIPEKEMERAQEIRNHFKT